MGAFKDVIMVKWVYKRGALIPNNLCSYKTGRDTIDFCLSTCTNQRNSHHHQRHSKKVADCELGGEPSSEPVLPDLDLGLLASNTKKINFCCLSHTACAILLCQLKAANTLILISLTLSSKNNPLAQWCWEIMVSLSSHMLWASYSRVLAAGAALLTIPATQKLPTDWIHSHERPERRKGALPLLF